MSAFEVANTSGIRRVRNQAGFTLIELLTVVVVMGGLAAVATGKTRMAIDQAKMAKAIGDIRAMSAEVQGYQAAANGLPASLADIDRSGLVDPWGQPDVYVNFTLGGTPRTDVFGVDLNTEYDIYSIGPDGASSLSLGAGASQDDIVRASDGGYIGRGSRY